MIRPIPIKICPLCKNRGYTTCTNRTTFKTRKRRCRKCFPRGKNAPPQVR